MTVSEATESNSNRDIPASRASGNPAGAKRPFLKQALPLKSAAAAFVFLVISGVVTVGVIRNNADERKRVEARLQAEELGKKREEEERVARQLREAEIARQEKEAAERREAERKAEEARKQTEEELEKKREEEERVARKLREAEIARREKEAAERREAERKAEEARKQAEEELQKKREEERERIEKERIEMERKAREESIRLEQEKREAERKAAEKREAEEREREKKRIAAEKAAKELALQEEKRKAALKKAEEDRIKKKNERRNEALLAFEEACEQNVALAFIRKVSGIVGEAGVPDGIYRQFKDLSKQSTLSREEKLATAAKLTSEVKLIVANLEDYAKEYLRDAEEQLTDSLAKPEYRKSLEEVPRKVEEFLGHASAVVNGDPSDPEVQLECALIIHSVPKWL